MVYSHLAKPYFPFRQIPNSPIAFRRIATSSRTPLQQWTMPQQLINGSLKIPLKNVKFQSSMIIFLIHFLVNSKFLTLTVFFCRILEPKLFICFNLTEYIMAHRTLFQTNLINIMLNLQSPLFAEAHHAITFFQRNLQLVIIILEITYS
jgi:hypothetical protein